MGCDAGAGIGVGDGGGGSSPSAVVGRGDASSVGDALGIGPDYSEYRDGAVFFAATTLLVFVLGEVVGAYAVSHAATAAAMDDASDAWSP